MVPRLVSVLVLASALAACASSPQRPSSAGAARSEQHGPEVVIRPQDSSEAFDYLWRQLGQMPFFRAHGYDVALPEHPLFQKAANEGRRVVSREEAERVFAAEVYDPSAFALGLRALEAIRPRLSPIFATFDRWKQRWGFVRKDVYRFVLTLYGPGGSYDPDTGTVTVLTSPTGTFKTEPLRNVVHEMVHIGVEQIIVQRHRLTHEEKERLVDRVCVVGFADELPDYPVQPLGADALDPYVDAAALDDLPAAIARFVAAHPRGGG